MQADLYLVASSLFRIGLRLPSNTSLSCSFSRSVLTVLVVRIASRFTDDEWCVFQVPSTVQFDQPQLKTRDSTTEAFSRLNLRCVFGFEKTVDVFESTAI